MIIPATFGQATIVYAGTAVPTGAVNTIGFDNLLGDDAQSIATNIENNWSDNVMPALGDGVELEFVHIKLGPNATGPSADSGAGAPGTDVGPGGSPQVAYLVSKRTSLGGRKGRGRFYLPGTDEESVDQQGLVASGKVTELQDGLDLFLLQMITDDIPAVLLHNDPTVPTDIHSLVVEQRVATIRKRVRR